MRALYGVVEKVAVGTISVLLLGETGVGKEVVARAVHSLSPRHDQSFVAINCAALSESLLESELFGHEKGAFTGAAATKMGLLESAHGGTVFLDEVGELPLSLQVKLLRALEERQVLRVGGLKPRDIDVRFVSATNRDLEADVKTGSYREDLLYRLNGVTLQIPPLREREQEIDAMARVFADESAVALGRPSPSLSAEALALLRSHPWPGNIRELRNVVERAVLLADEVIRSEHLPWHAAPTLAPTTGAMAPAATPIKTSADKVDDEEVRIRQALIECGGNQTRAAKLLGVSRRTLTRRLSHYDIARPLRDRDDE
jgi:transcriptional regulator with GAF, ATPase, and Fis domain